MVKKVVGYDENGPIYSEGSQTPSGSAASQKDPKKEEPGWFQPGSKSEAAVRGFSQGATLGLAPRISALLSPGAYSNNLKQYLAADKAAAEAHPVVSAVGNLVGGAPSIIASGAGSIPMQIAKQTGIGALSGAGNAQEGSVLRDATTSGAVSGALAGALPAVGKVAGMGLDTIRGKADPKQLAEAAITYKNSLGGNVKAGKPIDFNNPKEMDALFARAKNPTYEPDAGAVLQNKLQKTYNNTPIVNKQGIETDAKFATEAGKPLLDSVASARGDNTIRNLLHASGKPNINEIGIDKPDWKQIVASHNLKNANEAGRTVLGSAVGGAALGGAGTAIATGGDLDKTLSAAGAGGVTGALAGGRYNAVRNTSKLRMPYELPTVPGVGAANAELANAVGGDIKEKLNVPSNPFGKITDYFKQSAGATNPRVTEMAQAAQETSDSDPDAKRKAAMVLQSSPEGRAVGNGDSPVRVFEN